MQSFAEINRDPESGRAAIASPAPQADLLQTTPKLSCRPIAALVPSCAKGLRCARA